MVSGKVMITSILEVKDAILKHGACAPAEVRVKGDVFDLIVTPEQSRGARGIVLNNVPGLAEVLKGNFGAIRRVTITQGEFKIFQGTHLANGATFGICGETQPNVVKYDRRFVDDICPFDIIVVRSDDGMYTMSFVIGDEKMDIVHCNLILAVDMEPIIPENIEEKGE